VKTLRTEPSASALSAGRRRLVAVLPALLMSALPVGFSFAAPMFDLPALGALLSQRRNAEARFSEERFVSGLDSPLYSSGTLSFSAPDRLARHTLEPRAESMIVDGNVATLRRGGRSRQLALDTVPELNALVEALRGTLNGDPGTIEKHFRTRVEGSAEGWSLSLTPRAGAGGMGAQVKELRLAGRGAELRTVSLWLTGGDRSVMTLETLPSASINPPAAPAAATPASAAR
jgi:hypothetical protein